MLSTPSKHALRALMYLAKSDASEYLMVQTIAKETDVPAAYLSKLMKALAKAGIVVTRKGVNGGARLARKTITFLEVCEVLQDPVVYESCFLSNKHCNDRSPCPLHETWLKERGRLLRLLKNMKIQRST